jgi:hypothetical protein
MLTRSDFMYSDIYEYEYLWGMFNVTFVNVKKKLGGHAVA